MDRMALALIVLTVYFLVGTLLAVIGRRYLAGWSESEFFIAGRRLGGRLSALNYATTTYSAFMVVGLVGYSYMWGVGSFGFEVAYFIATVGLLLVFSRRVWLMARERGWVSPGEMLADLYGSQMLAILVSSIYLVALIPYASAQLKGVGEAVAGLLGDKYYHAGIVLGVIIMVLWSLLAGMWSIALTNFFQALWIIAAMLGYLAWVYLELSRAGIGLSDVASIVSREDLMSLKYWPLDKFLTYTLPWVFFAVTNPHVVQRLYTPRNEASLADMIRWFSVYGLLYTTIVTLIGLMARAGVEAGVFPEPGGIDKVTPTLLTLMHPLLSAILFTSIMAEAVNTADSIVLTLSSSVSRDLLARRLDEKSRRIAAYTTIVLATLATAIIAGQRVGFIVDLSVLTSLMLLPLAPATIAAWAGFRPGKTGAVASIVSGFALLVAFMVEQKSPLAVFRLSPLGVPLSAWILVVSTLALIAGWMPWRHSRTQARDSARRA